MSVTLSEPSFRALARSSPWLWSTLQFVHEERGPGRDDHRAVRAWLRRPDRLRVEDRDTGELLQVVHQGPSGGRWLRSSGGRARPPTLADDLDPAYRPDGLVARRPWRPDTDAPMYGSYQWVALLDPVELADGRNRSHTDPSPGTVLTDLVESEHHGRRVWDAIVRPTADYDPRCACCPLLLHTETDLPPPAHVTRAQAHHVRLDIGTGVCVYVRQIGGTHDGWTLDVTIEAVDEPMDDALFPEPRRVRRQRSGRS